MARILVALIPVAHIVGAILVWRILLFAISLFSESLGERGTQAALKEISVALGVPVKRLDDDENVPNVMAFCAQKYRNDLFRNRLSDLIGLFRVAWLKLGSFGEMFYLGAVAWFTFTEGAHVAPYAWLVLVLPVLVVFVSGVITVFCWLLTARWPGQARASRQFMARQINKPDSGPLR